MLYPAKDLIFYQADIHGNQLVADRMKVLRKLIEGRPVTVVTTFAALMSPQVPLEEIADAVIHIDTDSTVDEAELRSSFRGWGMKKTGRWKRRGSFPSGAASLISST